MAATTPLRADTGGIHGVAAALGAAAHGLTSLGADPLAHPPLAADETSGSVAARLSGHGAVLASRAVDGAAVLHSAAVAIAQMAVAYAEMDIANQAVVSLRGNASAPAVPAATPAITINAVVPDIPVLAPVPRPGSVTAQILDAGQPDAGGSFVAACQAAGAEFRNCATAARAAAADINAHLEGEAGPRISAALGSFAAWAQTMAEHADSVAEWARQHRSRFTQTQQAAPKPAEFANAHRQLRMATAQFASHPGPNTAAAVTRAHASLAALDQRTTVVTAGYHFGEIPTAPPGPPRVVPVVKPGENPGDPPSTAPKTGPDHGVVPGDSHTGEDLPGISGDVLDDGTDGLLSGPEGAMGQGGMASALPSMLTGLLGGMVGAAAAIPQSVGQQVQGMASQALQGIGGLTSGLTDADDDLGDIGGGDLGLGGGGGMSGGGGGGGGETLPAGVPKLPTATDGMLAMSAPPSGPPLAGLAAASSAAMPAAAAGVGGAPMMMPMGGAGMGAGGGAGNRTVKEPDKRIETVPQPNTAPVKGAVLRAETTRADDSPKTQPRPPAPAKAATPRRIEVPKESERRS